MKTQRCLYSLLMLLVVSCDSGAGPIENLARDLAGGVLPGDLSTAVLERHSSAEFVPHMGFRISRSGLLPDLDVLEFQLRRVGDQPPRVPTTVEAVRLAGLSSRGPGAVVDSLATWLGRPSETGCLPSTLIGDTDAWLWREKETSLTLLALVSRTSESSNGIAIRVYLIADSSLLGDIVPGYQTVACSRAQRRDEHGDGQAVL